MSKIIDITDKLNFEERPQIKIKDTVVNVNDDAISMLKVTAIFEDAIIILRHQVFLIFMNYYLTMKQEQKLISFICQLKILQH